MARRNVCGVVCLMSALAAGSALAQGIEVHDQTARATGMGGAYAAQANDPSAIYYNPGGLALMKKKKGVVLGTNTGRFNESLYQGLAPGIGAGTTGKQTTSMNVVPYGFLAAPLGARAVFGIGTYSPYRMRTEWSTPASFAGRFTATQSAIDTLDVNPTVAIPLGDHLGFGAGFIYRTSKVSATRHVSALVGGQERDIATLDLKSDSKKAYGWNAGLLYRPSPRFSLGLAYRSRTKTEYFGVGRLAQISTGDAQFDQLIKASFPFDQDLALTTALNLPDEATAGIGIMPTESLLFEVDATRSGWKRTQDVSFLFPANGVLNTSYPLRLKDAFSYRAGIKYQFLTGPIVRFGYSQEKSPQPDATVGAFFPDANRSTISAGFGLDWLDVALAWTTYDRRIVTTSTTGLNGNYRQRAWMVSVTATK